MPIIDGRQIAKRRRAVLKETVANLDYVPKIVMIMVGDNPASAVYVAAKQKAAASVGLASGVHRFAADADMEAILTCIEALNKDATVHGILLQLPVPDHLDVNILLNAISPDKDVDGLHPTNAGLLFSGQNNLVPCTPLGCLQLIKSVRSNIQGLNAVVVGVSRLVGNPMAQLLMQERATVTQAHSKTRDLKEITRQADIIVAAAGVPKLITADHVNSRTVLIDVGITRLDDGSLVGDVDFDGIDHMAEDIHITPVPGGVGPMTITMLLENTVQAAGRYSSAYNV